METIYISSEDFANKDKFALLKFAYCADPEAFRKAFKDYIEFPPDFHYDDLKVLSELWESGEDKKAGFSVEQVFGTITVDLNKLATCNLKFV